MTALVLDIATTSAILFCVAIGLLFIFGVMKIINFAHGALLTIGGYAALVATRMGLSPWLSFALAAIAGLVVGAVIERVVVRPLYGRPLDAILATWGLAIVIGQLITLGFGREAQFAESPIHGTIDAFGTDYSGYRILMIAAAAAIGLAVAAVLHGTRLGLVTRAVIANEDLAAGLGINSRRVRFMTFSVGCAFAGLAGALITPLSSVDPNLGVPWLVNAFMLVIVAGASLVGLLAAATLLGGAQVIVATYANPVLGGLTIVVIAAVILRLRPKGFAHD
ncbi:amino acid/amide ABC transporter membrane protein 1, HAAT family [Rhizobiales bacterium GAS191]|nr:amino acid/amide ABC transporter membrane protein 1, HAAT family [Rhizobiales bacterium GAS191]